MKYLKLVGGIICIILGLISVGGLFYGRPIIDAVIGVSFWGTITYFLLRENPKNKEKTSKWKQTNKTTIPETQKNDSNGKLQTLKELHEQGILTDNEYYEKSAKLKTEQLQNKLKSTPEYKKLKELYDDEILTQDEFDNKVKTLKERQNNSNKNQNNKTSSKSHNEINKDILIGKWESNYRYLYFINNNEVVIITKDNSSKPMKGDFKISEGEIVNYFFEKKTTFKVIEITKDNLHFYENKNKRYFKKCFDFDGVLDFDLAEKEYKKFKRGYYLKMLALLLILILTYFIFKK